MTLETQLRETLRAKADRLPDPSALEFQLQQPAIRRRRPGALIAVASFVVVIVSVGAIAFLGSDGRGPVGATVPATSRGSEPDTTNTTGAIEVVPPGGVPGNDTTGTTGAIEVLPPGGVPGNDTTGTTVALEHGVTGFETGVTQAPIMDAVQLGLPELTPEGWALDVTTPTGDRLTLMIDADLGPFESVRYWPILHVTTATGEGLPMVLAHGVAAHDVAQVFTSVPIQEVSDVSTSEPDISHWTAPGTDVTTITWKDWVIGVSDTEESAITASEIVAALQLSETAEGFLVATSNNQGIVVRPQSAAVITYGTGNETGFSLQVSSTCDVYHSGEAPFTQTLARSGSRGMWCQTGGYQIVAQADGPNTDMTLGTIHDSLKIRSR